MATGYEANSGLAGRRRAALARRHGQHADDDLADHRRGDLRHAARGVRAARQADRPDARARPHRRAARSPRRRAPRSALNIVAADQYIALVLPTRMYKEEFAKRGLAPENLSRAAADAGTVTSPLVPWNSCGAYMAAVLGRPDAALPALLHLQHREPDPDRALRLHGLHDPAPARRREEDAAKRGRESMSTRIRRSVIALCLALPTVSGVARAQDRVDELMRATREAGAGDPGAAQGGERAAQGRSRRRSAGTTERIGRSTGGRKATIRPTTSNPGIRLDVAGQINPAMNIAGDGHETKAYFVDNDTSNTRIRFAGVGTFEEGPELGTLLEVAFSAEQLVRRQPGQRDGRRLHPGAPRGAVRDGRALRARDASAAVRPPPTTRRSTTSRW